MSEQKPIRYQQDNISPSGRRQASAMPKPTALEKASLIGGWLGLLAIIAGLVWAAVVKHFGALPLALVIGGVALGMLWLVVNIGKVGAAARGRQSRLIFNSAAFVAVILGIVVLLNYIGARHHLRKDLTESQQFSLSEQTRKVAQDLEKEVKLIAFIAPEHRDAAEAEDRLREYEMLSPKIKVERYDPKTNFAKVKEYAVDAHNVQWSPVIIVQSGDRTEDVVGVSEEQLTSAILAVSQGKKTRAYFLQGHGESALEGGVPNSVATLKSNLENQQYDVETLSLMAQKEPQVPDDCAVLIIIGPQKPLHDKETEAIKRYLSQDGKLFVAVGAPPAPGLEEILSSYGITPLDGMVMDPQMSLWGQINVPMVNAPASHKITRNLGAVILPVTRAFELESTPSQYPGAPPPPGPKPTALLESSSAAWLETTLKGQPKKDPGEQGGPLVMAALVDEAISPTPLMPGMPPPPSGNGMRLVVVGTPILVSDTLVDQGVNVGVVFALKSIAWLVENEKLISIPPKDTTPNRITVSDRQRNLAIVAVCLLPALIMLTGGVVWWRRRRG